MLCATALLSMALLGAGCKKGPTLVGKWNGTVSSPTGQSATATYEFKPEGGFTQVIPQGPATMTITGDYRIEKDDLTIDLKDVQTQGVPKQYEATVKNVFKAMIAKPLKAKVKFVSDDEVSLSTDGKKGGATLKRVKEGA